jgi:hypothetical protein
MAKTQPLKEIKVKQADTDGIIKENPLWVIPTSGDRLRLPFTKESKARSQLQEKVSVLVNGAFDEQRKRLSDTSVSPGEAILVGAKIDASCKRSLSWMRHKSNATLRALLQNFSEESSSLERLDKMIGDISLLDSGSAIREAIVFNAETHGSYLSLVKPQIDNLRTCYPAFAREDLSELDTDLLASAKLLLRMSMQNESRAQSKHWGNPAKGEFSDDINGARADIIRHTRHMTPALASVVIDHPEKLEFVLETLKARGVPVHQSDTLIQEIMATSAPLSSGAL